MNEHRRQRSSEKGLLMGLKRKLTSVVRSRRLRMDTACFEREYYKKSILSYPPRHVTVAITSACNNRCVFCAYHGLEAKGGMSNVYGLKFNLDLSVYKRIVDMCYEGRVPKIHICGTGEPFFHKDILKMIQYAIDVYGSASLQTNFFRPLFERFNYLDQIIDYGDHISYITTDILSGDPKTHEQFKRGSRFEDVVGAMEYVSNRSNIAFEVHYIITKHNYKYLDSLVIELARRRINCRIAVANLHPHDFNDFTSYNSLYVTTDEEITKALQKAKALGDEKGIRVSVPKPADAGDGMCGSFWTRFQTWPVRGIDRARYGENVIVGGCNAVVRGNLNTLGYMFDYDDIMDLWNNEYFVRIRGDLLKGIYPDEECKFCRNYSRLEQR